CATSVQQLRSFAVSWPPTAPTWLYTLSLHDALPISDLSITYPISRGPFRAPAELKAVRDVSFTLDSGRTLGVVGESGCGKSTLARGILRLQDPTSGTVQWNGQLVSQLSEAEFREVRPQ